MRFSRRLCALGIAVSAACGIDGADDPDGSASGTESVASALDGVCGSEPRQPPIGNSIRILSFNAELLSPWFSNPSPDLGLPANAITNEKATAVAAILRSGKFDVIGLSEVWDEDDGKDLLVSKLCPTYPNFVKSVDAHQVTEERPEDSGLMVFSKLPFLPLPDQSFVSSDSESSLGDNSNRIAFARFSTCAGDDCLASKGAVMVRLSHPSSGRILNFVTTHMQANDESAVRLQQMQDIRGRCESGLASFSNLITTTLGLSHAPLAGLCAWTNSEWVALTGDHNIPGEGAVRSSVHPGSAVNAAGPAEWEARLGAFSDTFATNRWALYDPWAETTSPADVGITNDTDDARLDYILTSRRTVTPPVTGPPPADLCVQHVTNPPELAGLSDHQPVAADLNLMAPQCNPRRAYAVLPTDVTFPGQSKAAKKLARTLTFPGSMQWFRVDEPGTYTFALSDAPASSALAFEVFTADNLSVPLGGAHMLGSDPIKTCALAPTGAPVCSTVIGTKFVVPQAPFFVRMFSTNRAVSGSYALMVYKYKCNAPTEPCAVLPHAPQPFTFPAAGTALNAEDAAWFQVDIAEQADSGVAQSLRFHADNTGPGAWVQPSLSVFDSTGANQLVAIDGLPVSGQLVTVNPANKQRVFRTASATTNQRVLLRVRRNNVNQNLSLKAGWQTNLVLVGALGPSGAKLVCEDETNPEVGSDEIRMRIKADGTWRDGGAASFDCNNNEHSRPWSSKIGVVRVLSEARIRIVEEDAFLSGGDDNSNAFFVDLLPLESEVTQTGKHTIHWSFSDGEYRLQFQVGTWRD